MAVLEVHGDLFDQEVEAFGHGVNCVGSMGAGIAVQFRQRYPSMYKAYRQACQAHELNLGQVFLWQEQHYIFNLATQYLPGRNADYEAIAKSARIAHKIMVKKDISSLALPQIGSGIGGLSWPRVRESLKEVFDKSSKTLVLVTYVKA